MTAEIAAATRKFADKLNPPLRIIAKDSEMTIHARRRCWVSMCENLMRRRFIAAAIINAAFKIVVVEMFIYQLYTLVCMMVEELAKINKRFSSGRIISKASMEFAESALKRTKNWHEQAAYIVRAIVVDHPFEDGNKRTATAYLIGLLETYKIPYDPFKIDKLVLTLAKGTKSIDKIRRMIKNAIR